MAKYAILENNKVINIIDAEESFIDGQNFQAVLETESTGIAYIHSIYENGVFLEPEREYPTNDADPENGIPASPF